MRAIVINTLALIFDVLSSPYVGFLSTCLAGASETKRLRLVSGNAELCIYL